MVCLCYTYANFRGTMLLCLIHYVLLQVFGPFNFRMKKKQSNKMLTIILLLQTECKITGCKKNKCGFNPDMNTESMTASKHPTTTSIVR